MQLFYAATAVIGTASVLVKAVAAATKVTPNSDSDPCATTLEKKLSKVLKIIDRLALNPDMDKARLPKKVSEGRLRK